MKSASVLGLVWLLVVGCGTSFLGEGEADGGVNGQGGSAGIQGAGGSAGAWSPCAGLACGTPCNMAACPPSQEACPTIYAPGYCDQNGACVQENVECTTGNPCAGKACGDTCTPPCPSGQACPAVVGYCGENGACSLAYPVCSTGSCQSNSDCVTPLPACGQCPDGSSVCTVATCVNGQCAYATPACPSDPCVGKGCGDTCVPPCPSGQNCPAVLGYCGESGACTLAYPVCSGGSCQLDTDCPAPPPGPCQQCSDSTFVCYRSSCVNGQCAYVVPGCPNYSPCAGKACGDACSPCNPADPACVVPTTPMYCNADLGCQMDEPACGAGYGSCGTIDDCPRVPYPCRLCGGGGTTPPCGGLTCLGGSCRLTCGL